jgi:DRTGG domain.
MKLQKVAELIGAWVLACEELLEKDVENVFCTDMMADVLAFSIPDAVLITRLHNLSVVRSALMADIHCIVFSDGLVPGPEILALAETHELVVMTVESTMFTATETLLDAGLAEADWS